MGPPSGWPFFVWASAKLRHTRFFAHISEFLPEQLCHPCPCATTESWTGSSLAESSAVPTGILTATSLEVAYRTFASSRMPSSRLPVSMTPRTTSMATCNGTTSGRSEEAVWLSAAWTIRRCVLAGRRVSGLSNCSCRPLDNLSRVHLVRTHTRLSRRRRRRTGSFSLRTTHSSMRTSAPGKSACSGQSPLARSWLDLRFYKRGSVVMSRWPDPKHHGANPGFAQMR